MQSSKEPFRTRFEQRASKVLSTFDAMANDAQKQVWAMARTASNWARRTSEELGQAFARAEARAGRSAR